MRRILARLNRRWQAGWCYAAIALAFSAGFIAELLHSKTLMAITWGLIVVGFLVNLAYAVPLVRLLAKRRSARRAQRERI